MNRIHYLYSALIALNILAAILISISMFTAANTTLVIVEAVLVSLNTFLIWFNFGQMNQMLEREGYEPVTMKSIKFSPAVSAFLVKHFYK